MAAATIWSDGADTLTAPDQDGVSLEFLVAEEGEESLKRDGMADRIPGCGQRVVAVGVAVLPLLGCQKSLPTAPSDLMTGVIIYQHADYSGQSAHVTQDIEDLKDFKGPCERVDVSGGTIPSADIKHEWDDCISSIRVAPGWRATLYRDDDFDGDRLDVTRDIPNLQLVNGRCDKGGFNDCVTSIRVFPP